MRWPQRVLPSIGLLALALFVGLALPPAARSARLFLRSGAFAAESPLEARRRVFGATYVDAVDRIRRAVPTDEEYLLVDGGGRDRGSVFWLRYDLAPRRARFLGRPGGISGRKVRRDYAASALAVVCGESGEPPLLLSRDELLQWLHERRAH